MSGWNIQKTSLQEVGGSLFRVMKVLCRQQNTSWDGAQANTIVNTSAYKANFNLKFPQEWNVNAPTVVAVESFCATGIPTYNLPAAGGQIPMTFAIRSDSLASAAVMEAHRFRGPIDVAVGGAGVPFSETSTSFIQAQKSNILQIIPNTFLLNFAYDKIIESGGLGPTNASYYYYGLNWSQPVNLRTAGNILSSSVCVNGNMDIYITAGFDFPQQGAGAGTAFDARLRTAVRLDGFTHSPLPPTSTGAVGGGWNAVLVFYQLCDAPK